MIRWQHPWLLCALALAAVPVILHLLGRSRAISQGWGAMMYLVGEAGSGQQIGRWSRRVLLALRCTVIAAIALFAAGPAIPGATAPATTVTEPTDAGLTVLCLDNSFSMSAMTEGFAPADGRSRAATRFDVARQAAVRMVSAMPAGEQVLLLPSSVATASIADWDTDKPAITYKMAELLTSPAPSGTGLPPRTGVSGNVVWLDRAAQLLRRRATAIMGSGDAGSLAPRPPLRLIIVTDWQASGWPSVEAAARALGLVGRALGGGGGASAEPVQVLWVLVGSPVTTDVGVVSAAAWSEPATTTLKQGGGAAGPASDGRVIRVAVTLQNSAAAPVGQLLIAITTAGSNSAPARRATATRFVSLAAGAREEFAFTIGTDELGYPPARGDLPTALRVSLPDEVMLSDNEVVTPVERKDRPRVAVIVADGASQAGSPGTFATRCTVAALMPRAMADVSSVAFDPANLPRPSAADNFSVTVVPVRDVGRLVRGAGGSRQGGFAAAVVLCPNALTDSARDALRRFTAGGGGVMVVPVPDSESVQTIGPTGAQVFGNDWRDLLPADAMQRVPQADAAAATGLRRVVSALDAQPWFDLLRSPSRPGKALPDEMVAALSDWEFANAWALALRPGAQPIAMLDGDVPLGAVWPGDPRGLAGNVAVMAVWPGVSCGNWAAKGQFPLLLQGLVSFLISPQAEALIDPRFAASPAPAAASAAAPADEWNLAPLSPRALDAIARLPGWHVVTVESGEAAAAIVPAVRGFYTGVPLWPYCLAVGVVALAAEMWLAARLIR